MKVLIYCQHVLGIGHLFRTLEIARAMPEHQVTLVLGGPPASVSLPEHVRVVQLPGLQMDAEFSGLFPVDPARSLDEIKSERKASLSSLTEEFQPDIMLIELFPFGRNGFSFELLPLLQAVRCGKLPSCKIVCSLRDILVEKKNREKFEQRVIDRLNTLFDALLIHGDPDIIQLDETFSRMNDIMPPVRYTGYICEKSDPEDGVALRTHHQISTEEKLIVVSSGGGNVGYHLLDASIRAYDLLDGPARMQVFTGPYLSDKHFAELERRAVPGIRVERFSNNFTAWLAAADLSISMGGYNTTMNVLASGTPGLILPFSQNREQKLRAEKLAAISNIQLLQEHTLSPDVMAENISSLIQMQKKIPNLRLDGAEKTNQWLTQWISSGVLS